MEKKVITTILQNKLINKGDYVIVGLSGGADSIALTNILVSLSDKLGIQVVAAHINHSLRKEADSEAEFVRRYCERCGVLFFEKKVDVAGYAKNEGIGEEQAGRKIRYDFFAELSKQFSPSVIATAHHKNDNAETVLMHIIRGAGIKGIRGIDYKRENIIRPLLDVTRIEIEEYCKDNRLEYCTDKSNFTLNYTRNKIRLKTIPHLESEYNENICDALTRLAKSAREDDGFLENYAKEKYKELVLDNKVQISSLVKLHNAILRRIVRIMIQNALGKCEDVTSYHIDAVENLIKCGKTGKCVDIQEDVCAFVEYDYLKIAKRHKADSFSYKINLGKKVYIKESDIYVTMEEAQDNCFILPCYDNVYITNRKDGDVFYPYGMSGKKKLKDFFIDIKLPRANRDIIPVVRYNNEIILIGNIRSDRRYFSKTGNGVVFKFERG